MTRFIGSLVFVSILVGMLFVIEGCQKTIEANKIIVDISTEEGNLRQILEMFLDTPTLGDFKDYMCEKGSVNPDFYPGYRLLDLKPLREEVASDKAVFYLEVLGINENSFMEYSGYYHENREHTIRDRGAGIMIRLWKESEGKTLRVELHRQPSGEWCVFSEEIKIL